jgi:hypothetical protein
MDSSVLEPTRLENLTVNTGKSTLAYLILCLATTYSRQLILQTGSPANWIIVCMKLDKVASE